MLRNHPTRQVLLAAMAMMLSLPTHAVTYTLTSDSTISVTGEIDAFFSGTGFGFPFTSTGSGVLAEQAPGSLTTGLQGTIDVSISGADFAFTSSIAATNSGSWQPTGTPANFGLTSSVFMDSSAPFPDFTMNVVGAVSDVTTNMSGAATLIGAVGNQSFSASLGGFITSGMVDALATSAFLPALAIEVPLTNIALTGVANGSLVSDGVIETLIIPFSAVAEFTVLVPINVSGVVGTTTFAMTRHITGEIVAVRPVPEPGTWAMLLAGLGLVGLRLGRRRT